MYRLYKRMVDRFDNFFLTKSFLEKDALIGTDEIILNNTSPYTKEAINNSFPEIFLMDEDTTFKSIPDGKEGADMVRIKKVVDDKKIILQNPLSRSWMASKKSFVRRAIVNKADGETGECINKIFLGDVQVIDKFGAISIIPRSKDISWKTLNSTIDKVSIDFVVYVRKKDNELATQSVLILSDIVEWILMSNLHIYPLGYSNPWERTNIAKVSGIQYGTISKGSAFLKAATLSWEAEMQFCRGYLTQQGNDNAIYNGYGDFDNFGPIHSK